MSDETIRALERISPAWAWIRRHAQVIVSVTATSIVWFIVQSFSVGAYREKIDQIDKHMESIDINAKEEKEGRQEMRETLGEIKTTVIGMDKRLGRVEDWRDGIRRDVQDANQVKIPGHRAKHP